MKHCLRALATTALAISLSLPPLRSLIEQSMLWHMVIQMLLLVLAGGLSMRAMAAHRTARRLAPWNRFGLSGFIAALGILAYWMLPLAIDRAIVLPAHDALKIASLIACGALLAHSAARAPAAVQLFFVGTAASMTIWLGLYFTNTERRLCNAYSLQSQVDAGWGLVALAVAFGAAWLAASFRRANGLADRRDLSRSAELAHACEQCTGLSPCPQASTAAPPHPKRLRASSDHAPSSCTAPAPPPA
jgi:hypothetical protein